MKARKERIVELMGDVREILSSMSAVDMGGVVVQDDTDRKETVMTSREIADLFEEHHSTVYRRIAQLVIEVSEADREEFIMSSFQTVKRQEYPMWELTEYGCELYLCKIEKNRCYGKTKDGVTRMKSTLKKRLGKEVARENQKKVQEEGYRDVRELFDQFITSKKGEEREIPELSKAYEVFNKVMNKEIRSARTNNAITTAVYDIAIEAEMQGFIYGFQLFGSIMQEYSNNTATKKYA